MTTWLITCNALIIVAIAGMLVGCERSERFSFGATIMVPLSTFVLNLDSQLELPTTDDTPLIRKYLLLLVGNCLLAMMVSNWRFAHLSNKRLSEGAARRIVLSAFLLVHVGINAWSVLRWSAARSDNTDLFPLILPFLQWGSWETASAWLGLYRNSSDGVESAAAMTLGDLNWSWSCTIAKGCVRH